MTTSDPRTLRVENLVVEYPKDRRSARFRALDGASLDIRPGETVGLVGESGSGKTTLGRAVLGLVRPTSGRILFEGNDITSVNRAYRRKHVNIQAIFQDPYTSLNPVLPIGEILSEPLRVRGHSRRESAKRVRTLLDRVRLPINTMGRLPHEFSGGQRQRIAIARALAMEPDLIVCDEPVSALDLTTQSTVLDLLIELQRDLGVTYLFISHDLSVIRHICHRVSVLFHGRIVEHGDTAMITSTPNHPYTQRLLAASPVADPVRQADRRHAFWQLPAYTREADFAPVAHRA